MSRRAIILVPGFSRKERHQSRDRLVRALQHYTDGWRVEQTDEGDGPTTGAIGLTAAARAGGETREIDVYEAYWGDLVPDWSNESPWARFKRGFFLIRYWLTGGVRGWLARGEAPPRAAWAMVIAAFLLILWWIVVAIFLMQAIGNGTITLPDSLTQIPVVQTVWNCLTGWTATIGGSVFALIMLWIWSLGWLEQFSNISAYTKAYLRDEALGDDDVGLRAKARHRVLEVLDQVADVHGDKAYDEIYVVGHSLGGAIAVDALAECGDLLERVVLFTWGSALGMLAQQEPLVEQEIAKFYTSETRVRSWVDVVFPKDFMGSKVPVPRRFGKDGAPGPSYDMLFPGAVAPTLPKGMHTLELTRIHEAYYRCETAVLMLVQPVTALPPLPDDPVGAGPRPVAGLRG
ncbi:alpha/beta hydrolase [Salipiger sp. P9]|uniref:alpha/beta hydrolase n=1 Tax=Salipiger pentaromativorans TaxID=2943193 RepID=UPI00215852EE|nr:alpha/beta hydrolase [Salipiger pentaromativorans]MCR8549817.1 alpha/beta hydrolase [Salipiger pentaromativorans]